MVVFFFLNGFKLNKRIKLSTLRAYRYIAVNGYAVSWLLNSVDIGCQNSNGFVHDAIVVTFSVLGQIFETILITHTLETFV